VALRYLEVVSVSRKILGENDDGWTWRKISSHSEKDLLKNVLKIAIQQPLGLAKF